MKSCLIRISFPFPVSYELLISLCYLLIERESLDRLTVRQVRPIVRLERLRLWKHVVGRLIHRDHQAVIRSWSLYRQLRLLCRQLSLWKIAASFWDCLLHELLSFFKRTLTSFIRVAQFDLSYTNSICLESSFDFASKAFQLVCLPEIGLLGVIVDLWVVRIILANFCFDALFLSQALRLLPGHGAEGARNFLTEF